MKNFKIIIATAIFLLSLIGVNAQVTTTDTVCQGATGKSYKVTKTTGSTYNWILTNGTKTSGGTTDSIQITWSSVATSGKVRVVEINSSGCPGDTQTMDVVIVAPATAKFTGTDTICYNTTPNNNKLKIDFTGIAPYSYTYTVNGGAALTGSSASTPGYINLAPTKYTSNVTVVLTTIKDKANRCSGTVTTGFTTTTIVVNPKPTTSGIFHY